MRRSRRRSRSWPAPATWSSTSDCARRCRQAWWPCWRFPAWGPGRSSSSTKSWVSKRWRTSAGPPKRALCVSSRGCPRRLSSRSWPGSRRWRPVRSGCVSDRRRRSSRRYWPSSRTCRACDRSSRPAPIGAGARRSATWIYWPRRIDRRSLSNGSPRSDRSSRCWQRGLIRLPSDCCAGRRST